MVILALATGALLAGLYFHRSGLSRQLWFLLLGVFLLALGPMLSAFLGSSPKFSISHLATPLVLMALIFLPSVHLAWFVREVKRLAFFYTMGSLVAAVLAPSWALEVPYKSYIPGFEVRLHGITVHANHTAPFVLLYLLFEVTFPNPTILRWFGLGVAGLVLILTQSKTTWVLLIIGLGLIHLFKLNQRPTSSRIAGNLFVIFLVLGSFLVAATSDVDLLENVTDWAKDRESDLITFTGRSYIWAVVLDIVRENPWFGYGPHLWDPEMALAYAPLLGWAPAQSHNQYLQSLGEGGIIGLVGLMAYGLIVLQTGWRYRFMGYGLPFVLPLLWFIRGFTESWYRGATTDGNLTIHMFIFAFIVLLVKNRGRE
ncbi:MAG: O-antigen ligase family protein [Candidatus Caldarchaeum sp.]